MTWLHENEAVVQAPVRATPPDGVSEYDPFT